MASVLLAALSAYRVIETGEVPLALGILGASQAVFWTSHLYYRKHPEKV